MKYSIAAAASATATGVSGAALSAALAEPLVQVFNGTGLVMALMGALGGATIALYDRKQWREGARQALIGALLAFGLGVLAPLIVGRMMGVDATSQTGLVQSLAGAAYVIGFAHERVAKWLLIVKGK